MPVVCSALTGPFSDVQGSVHKTLYVWNFNDTHNTSMTGLDNAQQQNHSFSKAGIYYVAVNASNSKGKHSSNVVRIRVEGKFQLTPAELTHCGSVTVFLSVWHTHANTNMHACIFAHMCAHTHTNTCTRTHACSLSLIKFSQSVSVSG